MVHAGAVGPFAMAWSGEPSLALPHGVLRSRAAQGEGLAAALLRGAAVTVRRREGGERLRIATNRPERLQGLLHKPGIAPWQRTTLPLVYCGDALAAVPGFGVDVAVSPASCPAWAARPPAPGPHTH